MAARTLLVTTALEQTGPAPASDPRQATLFLGNWCLRGRWASAGEVRPEVVPYHWDDQARFLGDHAYARSCSELLLPALAERLNEIHAIDRPLRYWRVLVGPWLRLFTEIVLDRWRSVESALGAGRDLWTIGRRSPDVLLPSQGMSDFHECFTADWWNHDVYLRLLSIQGAKKVEVVAGPHEVPTRAVMDVSARRIERLRLDVALANAIQRNPVASALRRRAPAFAFSTYLGPRRESLLQLSLGQFPLTPTHERHPRFAPAESKRRWSLTRDPADPFVCAASDLVATFLPTLYLEGFSYLVDAARKVEWPANPKLICTANLDMTNDLFMAYAAHHVSRGAKFVRIQHGGVMGSAQVSTFEEVQRASGDAYLSWGWKAEGDPKVKPVGHVLRPWPRRTRTHESMLTLVTVAPPPYSYWMHSGVQGADYPEYLRLQAEFGRRLPMEIRRRLLVRLYREDYGWKCADAWRTAVPEATLDSETGRLAELAPRTRLMVATYNSTAFLESFVAGVPTLLLWNPRVFAIRPAAEGAFEALRLAGILHHSAEEAARHVAEIWDDPAAWWRSNPVADAVSGFCETLNWRTPGALGRIRHVLRALAHDRSADDTA